jgi:hypothetical protein
MQQAEGLSVKAIDAADRVETAMTKVTQALESKKPEDLSAAQSAVKTRPSGLRPRARPRRRRRTRIHREQYLRCTSARVGRPRWPLFAWVFVDYRENRPRKCYAFCLWQRR